MRNSFFLLIYLLLNIHLIGQSNKNDDRKKYIDENSIVIFNYDSLPLEDRVFKSTVHSTFLDLSEIKLTDKILLNFIEKYNINAQKEYKEYKKSHPKSKINKYSFLIDYKKKYAKQFVPIINNNNQKEVWVNCFYTPQFKKEDLKYLDWKHKIITYSGGGKRFFNLKINLVTGVYYDVDVNDIE